MDPEGTRTDPRPLIFLLYLVIVQELICGWMEYRQQGARPKKQGGPTWASSGSRPRPGRSGYPRSPAHSLRRERFRDWRKAGRIIRKA